MARVFAKNLGATIRLGNFGTCTPEVPVEVPDDVAQELLALNVEVRVELGEMPAPRLARKAPKEEKEG